MAANWTTFNTTSGFIGIGTTPNTINNINIYSDDLYNSNQLLISSMSNLANIQFNNNLSNASIGIGCSEILGNYKNNLYFETNNTIILNSGRKNLSTITDFSEIANVKITKNNIGFYAKSYLEPRYTLDIESDNSNVIINDTYKVDATYKVNSKNIYYPTCTVNNNIYGENELSNLINNIAFDIASPLKRYPPKTYDSSTEMTFINNTISNYSNTFTVNNYQNGYGIGTYKVITSSGGIETNVNFLKSRLLFNLTNNSTDEINSSGFLFDSNIDNYNNLGNYIRTNNINSSYLGGWIKIQFPEPIILRKFAFLSHAKSGFTINDYKFLPGSWKCYGSSNDITYTEIPEANSPYRITDQYYFNNQLKYTHYLANTFNTSYNYIAWTFNQLSGTNINTNNSLRHLYEI
jgi:hypothetical protein